MGTLSLPHLYDSHRRIYNQSQIQSGKPFPYVEVVVCQDDNHSDGNDYLQALVNMEMPIYIALSHPIRLQKITDIRTIPWGILALKSDYDLSTQNTTMVPLSRILSDIRSIRHEHIYLDLSTFKEKLDRLDGSEFVILSFSSDHLKWIIDYLHEDSSGSLANQIFGIRFNLTDPKHLELFPQLLKHCSNLRHFSHQGEYTQNLDTLITLCSYLPDTLEELSFSASLIGDDEIKALSTCLPANLRSLSLDFNKDISDKGFSFLIPHLPSTLESLSLICTSIGDQSLKLLEHYLPPHLSYLDLRDNSHISKSMIQTFRERHRQIECRSGNHWWH